MANTDFPPDPRYGRNSVIGCSGVPDPDTGAVGDLATDPDTGNVYLKAQVGWQLLPAGAEV